jgi:L-2-hydroxyglutarate oxidase LhgO
VAVNEEQANRITELYERGIQNKVKDLRLIDADEIKKIEPNCVVIILEIKYYN